MIDIRFDGKYSHSYWIDNSNNIKNNKNNGTYTRYNMIFDGYDTI